MDGSNSGAFRSPARGVLTEQSALPPSLIPTGCKTITPEMLPLVELEPEHIERIVQSVPGGASNIQDIYPLAPLQEGMLFHHMMDSNSDTYVMVTLLELESHSNLEAFIDALRYVVERHDSLRTAVLWEQLPQPVQVVHRQVTLAVEELELNAVGDPVEQLREAMRHELRRLEPTRAPLMRVDVASDRRSGRWYALLKVHHLVCDAQSLEVMITEIAALLKGDVHRLAEPMQYRTHVAQALARTRSRADDAAEFFSGKLRTIDEPTAPYGLLDVHGDGRGHADACRMLEPTLALRLRAQARRHRVTPAAVFHAVWALVISQTSGRNDVVFGTVLLGRLQMTGRKQQGVGLFLNTLPVRLQLGDTTARDLLLKTQRELWELLNYEQTCLAVAQRCSGVSGSAPLFTALLNYLHRAENSGSSRTGATAGFRQVAVQAWSNYPLCLSIDDLRDGFALNVQTDYRIDPDRVAEYVVTATRSLVEALERPPQTPAAALSILPESERRLLTGSFNATQISYPGEGLIHRLFDEQVERTPDATAAVHGGQSLTYLELNGRADQLAHHLLGLGVGTAHLVGICVERSLEMIVGVLGILKAGAAYVPLDPNYPTERLQYMLEDAAPQVVVTQESLRGRLPAIQARQVVLDGELRDVAGDESKSFLPADRGVFSHNLVYVIYTSGSTGRPKGTAMPHRAMANLIQWHRSTFGGSEGCHVLQFAALSFDVAFQEIFSTLCTGGTLVLLDEWVRRDLHALAALLHKSYIDRLFLPPLMLQSLAEYCLDSTPPPRLRDIITAGEQLRITPEIVAFFGKLQCAMPRESCRLHNHYGPTETHVVTALSLAGEPGQWPTLPPVGRPIANTTIYILDAQQQPVVLGVPGEIYLGGAGVAHGYVKRPQLTAERFIPNPFDDDPGARLYRTGDLGCWRPDGVLQYLGRNDDQVKLRGYRIELGEIEAQLERHARVKEAVVIAREDTPGEKRLVAYLTCTASTGGLPQDVEELRAYLRTVLPDYMVPSAFVCVEKLPLTPNGKLDRRALPAPTPGVNGSSQYAAPEGELERILAGIWCEVLKVERVGRDDNFFDLGGHSVLGMRLIAKVAQRLAIQAPVVAIFRYPTIRDMASLFQKLNAVEVRIPQRQNARRAPLTYSQELWWNRLQLDTRVSMRAVAGAARLSGQLNIAALRGSFAELVRRHEALRTRIVTVDGVPGQLVDEQFECDLKLIDLRPLPENERSARTRDMIEHFIHEPVSVAAGPLFAARLIELGDQDHVLVIATEHMISDGVSIGILWRELFTLYERLGKKAAQQLLSPPSVQFGDYAQWQQQMSLTWAREHGDYWTQRLHGAKRVQLSENDTTPAGRRPRWGRHPVWWGEVVSDRLRALSRRENTSLVMAALTAYVAFVLQWCRITDLVMVFVANGRLHPAVENTVGYFAAPLFLRIELLGGDSFLDLLKRVGEEYSRAYEHSDSGKVAAEVPSPEFAWNPRFNWLPRELNRSLSGPIDDSDAQTRLAIEPYELEVLPREDIQWDGELELLIADGSDGVRGHFVYRADRLTAHSVECFARNLQLFVEKMVGEPLSRVSAVLCER